MSLPPDQRSDIGARLGLGEVPGSDPPRWEGRRDGLQITIERRPLPPLPRPSATWRWTVALRHASFVEGLGLEPVVGDGRPPLDQPLYGATGDPSFDQEIRITGEAELALAALDQLTRQRLRQLFAGGSAAWRAGALHFWRDTPDPELEPIGLADALKEAIWIAGRWVRLDASGGLVRIARGDPLLTVRVAAAGVLARRAPARLAEILRTLDGLIDAWLRAPAPSDRLVRLLALPVVQRRIEVRLGWRRTALLELIESTLTGDPELLSAFTEPVWLRLLEGGARARKISVLRLLGERGQSKEALAATERHAEGLFGGSLKSAAKEAREQLRTRVRGGAGALSMVDGEGELSLIDAGGLAVVEEERAGRRRR